MTSSLGTLTVDPRLPQRQYFVSPLGVPVAIAWMASRRTPVDGFSNAYREMDDLTFLDSLLGRHGSCYAAELANVVKTFAPGASRFLEWGSGESTKVLCDFAKGGPNPFVLSIDDSDEYQRGVAASLPLYSFIHFRRLDLQGPSYSREDQYPSYSSYPFFIGVEFDVAFIGGRRRAECALTAAQVVSESGIVIVHDWRRSRYATARMLFDTLHEGEQMLVLRPKSFERRPRERGNERRVVVVPARGGRALRELDITRPYTEAYAKTVGADFHVVGQSSKLPPERLKAEALEVSDSYDRMLLLDADVLIRPGSPDIFAIVPDGSLGAFEEGRVFPREETCRQLDAIYGLGNALAPQNYFNSGVLVFSRSNLVLLRALRDEIVWGHPQFEQGFLNAKRVDLGIPLFSLPFDFNYMPDASVTARDWRYSFFLHVAGAVKERYAYSEIWTDTVGDLRTFTPKPFRGSYVRSGVIRQMSEQIKGRSVRMLDPTDFTYCEEHAKPIYNADGAVVVFFRPQRTGAERPIAVWGPYIPLDAGRWRLQFLKQDGSSFVYGGAALDIVRDGGKVEVVRRREWPRDGTIEFQLKEKAEHVEFRIFCSEASAELANWRLELLGGNVQVSPTDAGRSR